MRIEIDRPRWNPVEMQWALKQLIASGLLEQKGEGIRLTTLGIDHCLALEQEMGAKDTLLLDMFYALEASILASEEGRT